MAERQRARYRQMMQDSARWDGFELRPDDIIISTPPKCGTTWTQMICALLIFGTPEFDRPLALISPWLDSLTSSRDEVFAIYAAQSHRRFIKTHTPLDGLPLDERITYLCVGRDPRDVALSMDNHLDNMDMDAVMAARTTAGETEGMAGDIAARPTRAATPIGRFWEWADNDEPPTTTGSTLRRTLHHIDTFWRADPGLDVVMLHYADLKADLDGEMRRLAAHLSIPVDETRWDELVAAASFESMRARAERVAPSIDARIWRDTREFFHRGTNGQWRDLLGPDDLARYDQRVKSLVGPDVAAWVHHEPAVAT
ncbi:MAG: glycolipid sulfotransferase [Acidimicrobiales bacterium]